MALTDYSCNGDKCSAYGPDSAAAFTYLRQVTNQWFQQVEGAPPSGGYLSPTDTTVDNAVLAAVNLALGNAYGSVAVLAADAQGAAADIDAALGNAGKPVLPPPGTSTSAGGSSLWVWAAVAVGVVILSRRGGLT